MENPASWTEAEKVVHEARLQWEEGRKEFRCGASFEMQVCNALRAAGLLAPYEAPKEV